MGDHNFNPLLKFLHGGVSALNFAFLSEHFLTRRFSHNLPKVKNFRWTLSPTLPPLAMTPLEYIDIVSSPSSVTTVRPDRSC